MMTDQQQSSRNCPKPTLSATMTTPVRIGLRSQYTVAREDSNLGRYIELGEYPGEKILKMAQGGGLVQTDLIYAEGFSEWMKLGSFDGLFVPQIPPTPSYPDDAEPAQTMALPQDELPALPPVPPIIPPIICPSNEVSTLPPAPPIIPPIGSQQGEATTFKASSSDSSIVPLNIVTPNPAPTDWRYETEEISTFKAILAVAWKNYQLHFIERRGDRLIVCTRDGQREEFVFGQFEATFFTDKNDVRFFTLKDTQNPNRKKSFKEVLLSAPVGLLDADDWWDEIVGKVGFQETGLSKALGCLSWFT